MPENIVNQGQDNLGEADTLTMTLFHSALRRDLERARIVLSTPSIPSRKRRRLGRHLQWVTHVLRWHHEGEDHYLWPLLIERAPEDRAVFDALEAEHESIDEPLLRLEAAARGLVAGRVEPAGAVEALEALEVPLLSHLAHEEGEGMRIVSRVLSHREWEFFEQRAWIDGFTLFETIRFFSWLCDGVRWTNRLRQRAGFPIALGPLLRPLSAIARVPGISVWAGSTSAAVKSCVDIAEPTRGTQTGQK
ncbi:hemerythrin domain-containing protein [Brevibacterium picturae]|uniref:Hemerythrin-like domain-containing protein n=1 Tax=Brevibacterium picturae TaxID=260553 RepID=A0ABN2CUR9_9MICO